MRNYFSLGFTGPRQFNPYINDPFVTVLLHGDKVNVDGEQHLLDYSPLRLGHVVMSGGCTVSAGGKFGNASIAFNSAGSGYCYPPAHAGQNLSTGDWTIDWWEYRFNTEAGRPSFINTTVRTGYPGILAGWPENGRLKLYISSSASAWDAVVSLDMGVCVASQWIHQAIVRRGTTIYTFQNGALIATAVMTGTVANHNSQFLLGLWQHDNSNNYLFAGHIDEFRISKGVARWTSNFAVPTAAYGPTTFDDKTVLLLHGDGVDGGAVITDSSVHGQVANVGTPRTKPSGYFGPTSIQFLADASSIIHFNYNEDFNFRAGDFSIDWWEFRYDSVGARSAAARDAASIYTPWLLAYASGTNVYFYATSNGSSWDIVSAANMGPIVVNTWVHRAMSRRANTWRFFHNGVLQSTVVAGGSILVNTNNLSIGYAQNGQCLFNGHIDEFRIVKGEARFIYNFAVPIAPYDINNIPAPINEPYATSFVVTAPATAKAGTAFSVTVQAMAAGAGTSNYTGAVHFTGTAGLALPGDAFLTNGAGTFSVTPTTGGNKTITATDTVTGSITGTSGNIAVTAISAGSAVFYASQWWTVPSNFNPASNTIEIYGAGGGGASSANDYSNVSSGGGGGGYCRYHNWGIVEGQAFYMNVSGGGPSDNWAGRTGIHDGTTWYLYAESGAPGGRSPNGYAAGGAGGSGAGGNGANHTGGTGGGGIGPSGNFEGGVGGGGAGYDGHGSGQTPGGGNANYGGNPSSGAGYAYGGGGAGANYIGGAAGGAGAQGLIIISWTA